MQRGKLVRVFGAAVGTAVLFGVLALPAPARADDALTLIPARAKVTTVSPRTPASLGGPGYTRPGALAGPTPAPAHASFGNAFVYTAGPQPLGIRGRLNVGKSGVYVPYYGNVGGDPLHPSLQGSAGIGFGFRNNLDISVYNNGFTYGTVPGADAPRTNPSLSFSIRF